MATAAVSVFLMTGAPAFASSSILGPVTVDSTYTTGEGTVDFTRPSVLEATFSVDKVSETEAYITAGNVANGERGYGFGLIGNMIYLVSNNGGVAQKMPLAFIYPGVVTHAKASYTPGDAIRVDTNSFSEGVFSQYSRGILMGSMPTSRFFPLLTAQVKNAVVTVGSWSYSD